MKKNIDSRNYLLFISFEDNKTGVDSFTSILGITVMAASSCIADKDIFIGVAGISKSSGQGLLTEMGFGDIIVTVSANGKVYFFEILKI